MRLSTRYGILTPYTSFLADDRVDLYAFSANASRAEANLRELSDATTGGRGVGQRVDKKKRKQRARAADSGAQVATDYEGKETLISTVQNLGVKTFYQKKGRWSDSTVTPEQEKRAVRLVQYSDEYFDVVRRLPATQNQYFAMDGELLVNIEGQTYLIVAAAN